MKIFISILVLSFSINAQDSLVEISNFGSNPGNLALFVYSPSAIGDDLKPLVIALHGCSQGAKDIAELTGWNKLAFENNFTMLYPQQKFGNNGNLCFNWFKEKDISGIEGESESIRQMIASVIQNYPVDTSRIYITGLSAGAAMSIVLMVNHPQLFQAGATFAGGPFGIVKNKKSDALKLMRGTMKISREELIESITSIHPKGSKEYPELFIYHGEKDKVVNKQNALWLIDQWTGIYDVDAVVDNTTENFAGNQFIDQAIYKNSNGEAVVTLYRIKDSGHSVPIDPGNTSTQGGEMGLFAVDINFHSTYQVAKDFGLIQK